MATSESKGQGYKLAAEKGTDFSEKQYVKQKSPS